MAETRKFDPTEGDDFAAYVRGAIGGDVRPNTPGFPSVGVAPEAEDEDGTSLLDVPFIDFGTVEIDDEGN